MDVSTKSPPKKRFKVLSSEELKDKKQFLQNKNSLNIEKRADSAFPKFLKEAGASQEYHLFKEKELDECLSKFWFGSYTKEVKDGKEDGFYTVNS